MMMLCLHQYCMPGAMNNVLSDGTHMNDNNITTSSSSLTNCFFFFLNNFVVVFFDLAIVLELSFDSSFESCTHSNSN